MMWMFAGFLTTVVAAVEVPNEPVERPCCSHHTDGARPRPRRGARNPPRDACYRVLPAAVRRAAGLGTCFEEDYFGVFDGLVALEPSPHRSQETRTACCAHSWSFPSP